MKQGIVLIQAALLCCLLLSSALNAEVYRWTDENGVTHFSQTPPPDEVESVIENVSDGIPDPESEGAGIDFDGAQSNLDQSADPAAPSPADQVRQELAEESARKRAQLEAIQARCAQSQTRLAKIEPNRQVFYTNDEGETERMDDAARVAEVEQLREFLAANCP